MALQHTRLIFASLDAEESGLRGSRAYCRKHREALKSVPSCNFNLESIYNADELSFLTKDVNQSVRLSEAMVDECMAVASQLGHHTGRGAITVGGGGTEAAEFARIGVASTSLLGMENRFIRDGLYYHTMEDTVDNIDPAAVRYVSLTYIHNPLARGQSVFLLSLELSIQPLHISPAVPATRDFKISIKKV